jgi:hypothetical protein
MNVQADKPWSTAMKVALVALSVIGALVFLGSVGVVVHTWKTGGAVELAVVIRALAGGVWAVFSLFLLKHPEWKRYLAQRF